MEKYGVTVMAQEKTAEYRPDTLEDNLADLVTTGFNGKTQHNSYRPTISNTNVSESVQGFSVDGNAVNHAGSARVG